MKKIFFLSVLSLMLTLGCGNSTNNEKQEVSSVMVVNQKKEKTLKRYNLKSGMVKYKTTINGKVMGSTIDGSGTEELYFKDWGAVELKKTDNKQVTHINIFGQKKTEIEETHTINKLDNGKSYDVNTKKKVIYLRRDPAMEMLKTFNEGDVTDPAKKMLESMGGKQIGNEKILGYECEVWQIPGGKEWIYKGIPLKLEMTVMGIKTTNIATEAKFNTNVPDKYFALPDYPIQKEEGYRNDKEYAGDVKEMKANAKKMQKMSFDEFKRMMKKNNPEDYKNMTEKELKMSYQMMQKMAKKMAK